MQVKMVANLKLLLAKIRTFFVLNMMSVCKLPNIICYWVAGNHIDSNGIRNMITRIWFSKILQTTHFEKNQGAGKPDKAYKLQHVIDQLNTACQPAVFNANKRANDEDMAKFKGCHFCKQDVKNKPKKWGFKWWCCHCRKTGYLYEFEFSPKEKERQFFIWENRESSFWVKRSKILSVSFSLIPFSTILH